MVTETDTQSLSYTHLAGIGFQSPTGGTVAFAPDVDAYSPGPTYLTPSGVGLGPLTLETRPEYTAGIEDLRYWPDRPSMWDRIKEGLGFASVGLGALARPSTDTNTDMETDDPTFSRRDVLAMSAAVAGPALFAGTARAETDSLQFVEFTLEQNEGGLRIGIADVVTDVLDVTNTYYVSVDGAVVSEFDADDGTGLVPPGMTGLVELSTDDEVSSWARVKGLLADEEVEFEFELDTDLTEHAEGEEIVLSTDSVIVDSVYFAEDDETIVEVGRTSLPHEDEDDESEHGYYYVEEAEDGEHDRRLMYHVGDGAPHGTDVTIRTYVGIVAEAKDDAERLTQ